MSTFNVGQIRRAARDILKAGDAVENLPYPDEDGAEMLTMLGPKLRAEYNIERPGHRI